MELENFRYVRRNGSISEFIDTEARHRGPDVRQAAFKSSVEERREPYVEPQKQPPSYRRIEMENSTFAAGQPESSQLLGAYDPKLPSSQGRVAFSKATTKRTDPDPQSGAHSYDNLENTSREIWRAGPKIGRAERPCSAEAVRAAREAAKKQAAAANAKQLAVTSPSSVCNDSSGPENEQVIDNDTGKADIDAMRVEIGLRGWVPGGPHGGRGCDVAFIGHVPELGLGWWIGVDYDEPLGKNDGSINGVRYFESDPNHGGFVRPWKLRMGAFDPEEHELEKIAKAQEKAQQEKQRRLEAMKSELDPVTSLPFNVETARVHANHASFRGSVDRFGDYISERSLGGDSHLRELDAGQYADKLTPRQWQRHDLTITKRVGHQTVTTSRPDRAFVRPTSKARKRKPVDKSSHSLQKYQRPGAHQKSRDDPVDNSLYPEEILCLLLHSKDSTTYDSNPDDAKTVHLRAYISPNAPRDIFEKIVTIVITQLPVAKLSRVKLTQCTWASIQPLGSCKIGDSAALQRQQNEHSVRMQTARSGARPTSASFHGAGTEARKIRACRSGGLNGTSNRRSSAGDHRSGVEPHYRHSWDENDWKNGRTSNSGSAWGGSVVGRFDSRLGFSAIASSDMPLTKQNGDLRPQSRSSTTSICSMETFVKDHGIDVRSSSMVSSSKRQSKSERRRRSSSAGQESKPATEVGRRRPASAGWSGGQGPVSSIAENSSLASLAEFVGNAVDRVTADQGRARLQRKQMTRLMSAGKRSALTREKLVVAPHTMLQKQPRSVSSQRSARQKRQSTA